MQEHREPSGDPAKYSGAQRFVKLKICPTPEERDALEARICSHGSLAEYMRHAVAEYIDERHPFPTRSDYRSRKREGTTSSVVLRLPEAFVNWLDEGAAAGGAKRSEALITVGLTFHETGTPRSRDILNKRITTARARTELREIAVGKILVQIQAMVDGHFGPVTALEVTELLVKLVSELAQINAAYQKLAAKKGLKRTLELPATGLNAIDQPGITNARKNTALPVGETPPDTKPSP